MPSPQLSRTKPVFLFLVLIALILGALPVLAQPPDPAVPQEPFTTWQNWSPNLATQFDLNRCRQLQSGDADGDGRDDLICAYYYANAETLTWVQFSDDTAYSGWIPQLASRQTQFSVDNCGIVRAADVDGDGRDDLICTYDYSAVNTRTWVQFAREPYTPWQSASPQTNQFNLNRCRFLDVGDADGDGTPDLLCAYDYSGNMTRTWIQFGGAESGVFSSWQSQHPLLLTQFDLNRCQASLTGDVDNDGRTDLICVYNYGGNETTTWVQRSGGMGDTRWQAWSPRATQFDPARCSGLNIGDANGDGLDDVICNYNYGNSVTRTFVQFSDGTALSGWTSQGDAQGLFDVNQCRPLRTANVYPNGRAELICAYDEDSTSTVTWVQVFENGSYSSWRAASPRTNQFSVGNCRPMLQGDANGNGQDDLVCPYDYGSNENRTWVQQTIGYRLTLPFISG